MKRRFLIAGLVGLTTLPLAACNTPVSEKTLGRLKALSAKVTEAAIRWGTAVAPELVAQISENNDAIQALTPDTNWVDLGRGAISRLVATATELIPLLPLPSSVSVLLRTIVAAINGVLPFLTGATPGSINAGIVSLDEGEKAAEALRLYVVGVRKLSQ